MKQIYEYRVVWRREGRTRKVTQFRQTLRGALDKAKRLEKLDQEYLDPGHYLHGMPKLDMQPIIQFREVGEWQVLEDPHSKCDCHPNKFWTSKCMECIPRIYP